MTIIRDRVTATDLARNLATLIDRVRVSGKRIAITRGSREVAQLTPPMNEGASAVELRSLLRHNTLTKTERHSLADDLQAICEKVSLPSSPWESRKSDFGPFPAHFRCICSVCASNGRKNDSQSLPLATAFILGQASRGCTRIIWHGGIELCRIVLRIGRYVGLDPTIRTSTKLMPQC